MKRCLMLIFLTYLLVLTSHAFADDMSRISIHAGSGATLSIELLLIDPMGRMTGVNLVTGEGGLDIPNAGYAWDEEPDINPRKTLSFREGSGGMYVLKVTSNATTLYWIWISMRDIDGNHTIFSSDGLTSAGRVSEYKIDYKSESGAVQKAEKIVTISDAKNDVNTAYDLGLITNVGIEQSLIAKLNAAEKAINKGKKQTAENQLNAFINEVNAQKDKHIKDEAIKILIEDAEYLINHL